MRDGGWSELLKTLRSMPRVYWLTLLLGLALAVLYFVDDCLIKPVCR
jgi:hypothetical protein